jgi:signal transduction histidine kinase
MTGTKDPTRTGGRVDQLLAAVLAVGSDLDLQQVLRRIVEAAVSLVDASYGALGVLAQDQVGLAQFITVGIDDETVKRIGPHPTGQGLLGKLITDPRPLRLHDITAHVASSGIPPHHPPMHSFLGVPVRVGRQVFGNLYLTEKRDGEDFTAEDQTVVMALAAAAGVAVQNARLYSESRRQAAWMEAGREISTALLSGAADVDVLAEVAEHGRRVMRSDIAFVALAQEAGLELRATSGEQSDALLLELSAQLQEVLDKGAPREVATTDRVGTAVPIGTRGVLVLLWREPPPLGFTEDVADFGRQAAVALELAERRREAERFALVEDRDRIARDLHDLVIQRLFATGMQLQSAIRLVDENPAETRKRLNQAVDELDGTIRELRSTIYGLQAPMQGRPSLRSQVLEIVDAMSEPLGFAPSLRLDGLVDTLATSELADHVLATLREALSNVARHAHAGRVDVVVGIRGKVFSVRVEDDGQGMEPDAARSGLVNLARRAETLGGEFRVTSSRGHGTTLLWKVPV